ncbi:hypothetical protein LAJ19_14800 (plasmid) [Deinococcus taeanensis]|uniref:hypothetical protein n=1 Tax=Deinococcus taeanensis TaxID=2737050 RepID=UPI001CDBA092|nr:hypothetical protein [Deinococcus taeanensis]UBV44078.1 hypothetical protein LAJ19_14800 [Deinococcus taeanensis]
MLSLDPVLQGVRLLEIAFATVPRAPLWTAQLEAGREVPAGTVLEPGEVVELELETEDRQPVWWTGRPTGTRTANLFRYGPHRLRLSCERGHPAALRAAERFLNASWLQGNADDPGLLRALAQLAPGEGVNLRDEGHAVRQEATVRVSPGESAVLPAPVQAVIAWTDWEEVLQLNLLFLEARAAMERRLRAAQRDADFPGDADLPRYRADLGFVGTRRWLD